jgi:NadR type nicotinamide-nucleotide adenylyltransferase
MNFPSTKKITITGPESSGKTTLARQLAEAFDTHWVPEYARAYLGLLDRPYRESDLLEIARGQIAREDEFAEKSGELLFCDTSLEVIKIWSDYRYGRCHPWILKQLEKRQPDLYLLCAPDLPWEYDPQRENPNDRDALFDIYRKELTGKKVREIRGEGEDRTQKAIETVQSLRA